MNGQYAFVMDGFDANAQLPFRDRVGTWTPNGSGTVSTSYIASGFLPDLTARRLRDFEHSVRNLFGRCQRTNYLDRQ